MYVVVYILIVLLSFLYFAINVVYCLHSNYLKTSMDGFDVRL